MHCSIAFDPHTPPPFEERSNSQKHMTVSFTFYISQIGFFYCTIVRKFSASDDVVMREDEEDESMPRLQKNGMS